MESAEQRTVARTSVVAAFAALALCASATQAQQTQVTGDRVATVDHAIEMYVSQDAIQAQYLRDLDISGVGRTQMRAGIFYNEERDLIGVIDLLAGIGDPADQLALDVRVGTRVYGAFLNEEDQDVAGVGIGGEAQWSFGRNRETAVVLIAFFSPDILTFGVADDVSDVSLRLQTLVGEGTTVFVGYRSFEFDTQLGDREVDDNVHIGFRRAF
jgi:YfaZ precursor